MRTMGWVLTDNMADDDRIIDAAFDIFERFKQGDKKALDPNIRGTVYRTVLQNGGEKEVRKSPTSLDVCSLPLIHSSTMLS